MEEEIQALADRIQGLRPETVDKPTLVYFNVVGIGWPIRCLLHLKEVDYELIPITVMQWGALKGLFTNGHVPLYVDKDIMISQSNPILTYLAEQHNMAGHGQSERFAVLEIMSHAYDALFHWNGLLQVIIKLNVPDDVVEARKEAFMGSGAWGIVTNGWTNHLRGFEGYLAANKADSGFFVGKELTIADLHAFNILCNWYKAFDRERFASEHPVLEDFVQRIGAIPRVNDYIRNLQEPTSWLPFPAAAIALATPGQLDGLIND